jgi:hypothetical protein
MAYSPAAHNTATAGRAGFVRLGTGVSGNSDGSLVTTSVPNGVTTGGSYSDPSWLTLSATKVGLGTTTNPQFNSLNIGGAYGTTAGVAYLGGANTYVSGNNTTMFVAGGTINFYSGGATQASVTSSGLQASSLGISGSSAATSVSSAALTVSGGLGIAKNLWVGDSLTFDKQVPTGGGFPDTGYTKGPTTIFQGGETKFGGEGFVRTLYFIILSTHIFLAAIILPFILNIMIFLVFGILKC